MVSQRFVVLVLLLVLYATATQVAKRTCTDRCGSVSIPFPFGTTEDCYLSHNFWVTCNESFAAIPRLFWANSTLEIVNISLTGQLKIMPLIAKRCFDQNGALASSVNPYLRTPRLFTINNTANRFTVIGCDSSGYITGYRGEGTFYSTGCISMCSEPNDLKDVSCTGLGCCQTATIPRDAWGFELNIGSFHNHTEVWNFSKCSYGFVAEEGAFTFSPENLTNLIDVERLPLVIDWVVGNETCEEAQMNSSTYACVGANSECHDAENTMGYRCRCSNGYKGNPYLVDGCRDIDECAGFNNCTYSCTNSIGGFKCACPKGFLGSGTGKGGCYCPRGGKSTDRLQDGSCFRDKNQCEHPELSNCSYDCASHGNTSKCTCPKGYLGNGSRVIDSQGCYCPNSTDTTIREFGCTNHTGDSSIYKVVAGTSVGVSVGIILVCLFCLEQKRRKSKKMMEFYYSRNGGKLLEDKLNAAGGTMSAGMAREVSSSNDETRIFSSAELKKATNNFNDTMIIGQGGFGTVFKGILTDNQLVAIKKSKHVDTTQIEQFINEVIVLSRISHRNVVKLLGCCLQTQVPLLVYEFVDNGTLFHHIHQRTECFLVWELRLKILTETADVLSYLHSAASTPIIHRDVKSANILLDRNFTAKVADFGASRLIPINQTQLSTVVQGTFGYLDPEYMLTNQLTQKSDVYSFGVVLVELITSMKALSYDRTEEERGLANFFLCQIKEGCLFEILDKKIVCDDNRNQLKEVARLAQGCLNIKGEDRPTMKEVAMVLEGLRSGGNQSWANTVEQNVHEEEMKSTSNVMEGFDGFVKVGGSSMRKGYYNLSDSV